MKNLQRSFEHVHAKLMHKKEYFKAFIDQLKQTGKLSEYNKLSQLLNEADEFDRDLQSNLLMVTAEGYTAEPILRNKIKSFKAIVRELNSSTKPLWRQWIEAVLTAMVLAFVIRNVVFGLYHVPSGSAEPTILVGDRIWANKFVYFFKAPQRGDLVVFDNAEYPYSSNKLVYLWQRYIGLPIPFLGINGGPENVIKRLIAVPGDTIEGRTEDGKTELYLNGKKLEEPYINPYPLIHVRKVVGIIDAEKIGPFRVPSFLRWQEFKHMQACSYDPQKSLSEQPFYKLADDEVVRDPLTGEFALSYPRMPSYDRTSFGSLRCADEFGPITIPPGRYWMMGDSRKNSRDSRYWFFLDEKLIHGRASFIIFSLDSCEPFWLFELIKHPVDFWTKKIRWNRFLNGLGLFNGRADLQKK